MQILGILDKELQHPQILVSKGEEGTWKLSPVDTKPRSDCSTEILPPSSVCVRDYPHTVKFLDSSRESYSSAQFPHSTTSLALQW